MIVKNRKQKVVEHELGALNDGQIVAEFPEGSVIIPGILLRVLLRLIFSVKMGGTTLRRP